MGRSHRGLFIVRRLPLTCQQRLSHGSDPPVILLDETPYSNSLTPVADHAPRVINVNFSPPSAGRIAAIFIGALIGVLLIAALWTSYYTAGAESGGVVLHFGEVFNTLEPGLHFNLPV